MPTNSYQCTNNNFIKYIMYLIMKRPFVSDITLFKISLKGPKTLQQHHNVICMFTNKKN